MTGGKSQETGISVVDSHKVSSSLVVGYSSHEGISGGKPKIGFVSNGGCHKVSSSLVVGYSSHEGISGGRPIQSGTVPAGTGPVDNGASDITVEDRSDPVDVDGVESVGSDVISWLTGCKESTAPTPTVCVSSAVEA